jgi:hypothetical protein
MAPSTDHTNVGLANRLTGYAEAIENPSMHEMELDLREAAKRLREAESPTPLIPRLVAELKKTALFAGDAETKTALRGLLGEFAG